MRMTPALVLASTVFLLLARITAADAQTPLAQLRQELIATWLMSVQGELRSRILRIDEVAQDTEGSYLINAVHGWIDGEQAPVRIELIQSTQQRRLIVRTAGGSLISVLQSPEGGFAGTFKPRQGAELAVRMEKVADDQLPRLAKESQARMAARVYADEDKDWGVPPRKQPRTDRYHAPTPKEVPGARTIRTVALRAMQNQTPGPILIDVLGGDGHRTIRGSSWLRGVGLGALDNAAKERLRLDLETLTAGSKSAPVVFFCLSSECWLSYNTSLLAMELGYTNVHWFRGGTAAWERAGFEMAEAVPYRRQEQKK